MMELKKLIEDNLRIPVIETFSPIIPPCATWYLVTDEAGIYGNGCEEETEEQYQVDVWGRDRSQVATHTSVLKKAIMQYRHVTVPSISYTYDTNGKMWRGTISFYHVREE